MPKKIKTKALVARFMPFWGQMGMDGQMAMDGPAQLYL